ncbi:MAG: hypothetical protein KIS67_12545 [Verrucomicrobiae bacterium]|nr:hypothetical protein [Verrucomicrobiae bacterium]
MDSPLPYRDRRPQGAADFYFAINATFRFIQDRLGLAGLRRYWTDLGTTYFAPVATSWKQRGLAGVAAYWRAFFAAEPGAEVEVTESPSVVTLNVKVCPAIRHLREHHRQIAPTFCQHCYFVSEAMARPAGLTVRIAGGNGSCCQTFARRNDSTPTQDLTQIEEAG